MEQRTLEQWNNSGPKIFNVSEVTSLISSLLNCDKLSNIWITGEISNFKRHSSGHLFFSLNETSNRSEFSVSCTLWKNSVRFLPFSPKDGMQVAAFGTINHYEKGGRYSFSVTQMRPTGAGERALMVENWKKELAAQGFFSAERKRPLPRYPKKIGVVTSRTGAVLQDIINIAKSRFSVEIILSPTSVQGINAHLEIANAIKEISDSVDVIIVGRGGGSYEDLFPFNNPAVVKAIATCPVPIVSAIGHEVDITLADLAADVRASTPSHAAELSIPDRKNETELLFHIKQQMQSQYYSIFAVYMEEIDYFKDHIAAEHILRILSDRHQYLIDLSDRCEASALRELEHRHILLSGLTAQIKAKNPLMILQREIPQRKESVHSFHERLLHAKEEYLNRQRMELKLYAAKIENNTKVQMLKQGYCRIFKDDIIVTSAKSLLPDDIINLVFIDGKVEATVKFVKE